MLSGKALLSLGRAQIGAIRWLWARYRRGVIDARVATQALTDDMYDDLIDFSRYAYPVATEETPVYHLNYTRDRIYSPNITSWARATLTILIAAGDKHADELKDAYIRAPVIVRLESIDGVWWDERTSDLNRRVELPSFYGSLVAEISDDYFNTIRTSAEELDDITTLLALASLSHTMEIEEAQQHRWLDLLLDKIEVTPVDCGPNLLLLQLGLRFDYYRDDISWSDDSRMWDLAPRVIVELQQDSLATPSDDEKLRITWMATDIALAYYARQRRVWGDASKEVEDTIDHCLRPLAKFADNTMFNTSWRGWGNGDIPDFTARAKWGGRIHELRAGKGF